MSRYLIFNLVDNIYGKKDQVINRYEGEDFKNTYCLEVYFKKLEFDKIICFGSEKSDWAYLYKIMCWKYNVKFENDYFDYLKDYSDMESIQDIFIEKFGEVIVIEYFSNNYSKNDLINRIFTLKNIINDNEIIIDFTGGKRYLIILILQLLLLIKNNLNETKNKKIEIVNSKYIGEKENKKLFEIFKLGDFVAKIDYIKEMNQFIKFGNPLDILKYLVDIELKNNIENLYIFSQLNVDKNIKIELNKLYNSLNKTKFRSDIQKIIISRMIRRWHKELKKGLPFYHRAINNEIYAILKEEDYDQFFRNRIAHPFDKNKKLSLEEVEKNFFIKPHKGKKYNKDILITNVGKEFITNKKRIKVNNEIFESRFLFKYIENFEEYEKIFFITGYYENWNKIIDDYIIENKLKHNRNIDFKNFIQNKEEFKIKLNEELFKLDERFEAIILDEADDLEKRDEYFKLLYDEFKEKNYLVSYDISFGTRETSYLNYINLYNLETLNIIKINKIFYSDLDEDKLSIFYNMNEINEILKIFKFFYEFEMYSKYDDTINISKELKEIIKNINLTLETNQFRLYYDVIKKIEEKNEFENTLEEELYKKIIKIKNEMKSDNDIEKGIYMVEKNLRYNNIGLSIFLLCDLFKNGLINQESLSKNSKDINFEKMRDFKNEFIKRSEELGFPEINKFYSKYEEIFLLRNKGMHNNSENYVKNYDVEKIVKQLKEFCKELKKLSRNRKKYSDEFYYFVKEKKYEKK